MRITKSEISMHHTWRSPMSATSQGAFVDIPYIIKKLCEKPCAFHSHNFFCRKYIAAPKMDKSAHNEIRDFYAHMAITYERRFVRCFYRYAGNIAQRYFLHNKRGLRSNLCQRLFTKKVQNLTFRY